MGAVVANILSGGLLNGIASIINSIRGKNPADADLLAQLTAKYQEDILNADAQFRQAQADVNKVEAANPKIFIAGWRPFIGWVCGCGLAAQFVIGPLVTWIATLAHHPVVFPSLDLGTLMTLLFGMLGLGSLRTYEKISGVQGVNEKD